MQPVQSNEGKELLAYVSASATKVDHVVHSMKKLQARRDASQKQAVQLGIQMAQLEADLASAKLQASEAQADVQSADKELEVLSQQLDVWEQQLESILTILHSAKRRRRH